MPDVNTPRYPAFAAPGGQSPTFGTPQPSAGMNGNGTPAAHPQASAWGIPAQGATPQAPAGRFPVAQRSASLLPGALRPGATPATGAARSAPLSLTATAFEDFLKGSITTGLLATLQQKTPHAHGHHLAAITGRLNRTTLRLALQGGTALAAGTSAARALRQSRPGAALLAAALGAGGVLLAECYLKDRPNGPASVFPDTDAQDDDGATFTEELEALSSFLQGEAPELGHPGADAAPSEDDVPPPIHGIDDVPPGHGAHDTPDGEASSSGTAPDSNRAGSGDPI